MTRPQSYWWFHGAAIDSLREHLAAAGPRARLEVRLVGADMEFRVVDPDGVQTESHNGWTNDSHICPPTCP